MKKRMLSKAVTLMWATAVVGQLAQDIPPAIQAPADQQLYLQVHAAGDQIYSCRSESRKFAWVLKAPEAQLSDSRGKAFGRHFAGPTWQSNDGSMVTGTLSAKVDSSDANAIPWLLLNVTSNQGAG